MTVSSFLKAGFLTLILVVAFFTSWELFLRSRGIKISYDDGESLWADKRAMVYEPQDDATVFIGSSRNKYDLDIETWRSLTGDHPIQLAIEGNSPLPVLDDLARDKNFKGKLIIDVTEGLFFTTNPQNISEPQDRIKYYHKRTPAQRFSFLVNKVLEDHLVFLDKNYFSLNALLDRMPVKKRAGVFALPYDCPRDFGAVTFDRQDIMTDRFLRDTVIQNQVKGLWDFYRKTNTEGLPSRHKADSILATVKADVDQIKARGGQIIFVRTPSSGPYLAGEKMAFPREKFWERILAVTGCPGIHFEDHPAIAHFVCPEFSHLKHSDAIVFTTNLVKILREEKGWRFPHSTVAIQ